MTPPATKAEWRAWARRARRALPDASDAVTAHLAAFLRARGARVILAYRAIRDEVSLDALPALMPAAAFAAPRAHDDGRLTAHAWHAATTTGALGVLEAPPGTPEVHAADLDAVLVPGLAFDERGGRLGYGRGYYDRLIPSLRADALVIGVTRDALIVPALPLEPHDALVKHLASESGVRAALAGNA